MLRLAALLLFLALLIPACNHAGTGKDTAAAATPVIPATNPLVKYDNLHLGMSSLEIAQAYPAPEGKGKGFTRVIEDYDSVSNHIIQFDPQGRLKRRIVLRVYKDQLVKLVDRREDLTAAQAADWMKQLKTKYGDKPQEVLPTIQWSWGDRAGVMLTFTQDNAYPDDLNANVVLEHRPSFDASEDYLRLRETSGGSSSK